MSIESARRTLLTLRLDFEKRKREEWDTLNKRLQDDLDHAIWDAHDAGESVAAIAREYGTQSRSTIYAYLKHRNA